MSNLNHNPAAKLLTLTIMIVVFSFCSAASCDRIVKPDPKLPTDSDQCEAACANLKALGCEEGEDVIDGDSGVAVTCTMFCLDLQGLGHALNPTCVAKITACDQLEPECSEK